MGVAIKYQGSVRGVDGKLHEHIEATCNQSDVASLPTDWPDGSAVLVKETKQVLIFDKKTGSWI